LTIIYEKLYLYLSLNYINKMKKAFFRVLLLLVLILSVYLTLFANRNQIKSAPVTNLKDQLSTAQLSFFGRVASYTGSILRINTTVGTNPSSITANLATGDTVAIANVGVTTNTLYVVRDIGDTSAIELTTSIGTTTPNAYIIATRSAIHTVSFTPQAAVSGEKWQFLIRATSRTGELINDGIPDQTGFDLGSDIGSTTIGLGTRLKVADISCPMNGTASVGTTTIITSGINVGYTGVYHVIQCAIGASMNSGVGITMIIGRALTTGSQLINPSPDLNHTPGQANNTADAHTYAIRQLDSADNILDTTFGKLAVTESVRVTAVVDPTITFTISNSNSTAVGTTRCGSPIGGGAPTTTATAIAFGPLVLGTYNNLSQSLSCTTNSQSGYVIQAYESRPLTMLGAATTIPDTNCEGSACTTVAQGAWTSFTNSGFGYSLEVGTTTGTTASIGITTPGHYKAFGVGTANAQTVLSRTNTPLGTDSIYVCYRAVAATTQQAGTYENSVSYIATATF
jgi:hypothetical protein